MMHQHRLWRYYNRKEQAFNDTYSATPFAVWRALRLKTTKTRRLCIALALYRSGKTTLFQQVKKA